MSISCFSAYDHKLYVIAYENQLIPYIGTVQIYFIFLLESA